MTTDNLTKIKSHIWAVRTPAGFRKLIKHYGCDPKNVSVSQHPTAFPCTAFVYYTKTFESDVKDKFICQILYNADIAKLLDELKFVQKSNKNANPSNDLLDTSSPETQNLPQVRI